MSPSRFVVPLAIALALTGSAPRAMAQTNDELTAARQTFIEGKELEKKGKWTEALEKFQKVAAVKMTPQVRFHVALCEENLGKLVSAARGFELAAEEAKLAGSSAAEVAQNAPVRAAALKKRLASLQLTIKGKLFTSKIFIDDAALGKGATDAPIPMDPGAHVIEVKNEKGSSTFRKELTLAEQASEAIELTIDDADPGAKKDGGSEPPAFVLVPPSRAPVYVAGSIGAASLVAAGVLYGLSAGTIAQVKETCKDQENLTGCDPSMQATADQGRLYGTLGTVMVGVGAAGVITAVTLYFVMKPKKVPASGAPAPAAPPPKASFWALPGSAGVAVSGSF